MTIVSNVLSNTGIQALGLSVPRIAPAWVSGANLPAVAGMSLSLAGATWLAPLPGTVRPVKLGAAGVTLTPPDGSPLTADGLLLTLLPQEYLRLCRLYWSVLEAPQNANPATDFAPPVRPVPRHFFYSGPLVAADMNGVAESGDALGAKNALTIYDNNGLPIDPLAVASAFQAIMTAHNVLQAKSGAFDLNSQVNQIANLGGAAATRIRLSQPDGTPYGGAHLTGLALVDANSGLSTLSAAKIDKDAKTNDAGAFPDAVWRLLLLGPTTTGRLSNSFSPPKPRTGVSLIRDFFSVRVIDLSGYLLARPVIPADKIYNLEQAPAIRLHEPLDLWSDGNDMAGAASRILAAATKQSLCVAQSIDGSFSPPTEPGANAHWPKFPAPLNVTSTSSPLSPALKDNLAPQASFIQDANPGPYVNVLLTLNNLPPDASVRVYPRQFIEDAREVRGDGAGAVVSAAGSITVQLDDPLSLKKAPVVTIPSQPILRFDMVVVKRNGESRIYGNIQTGIGAAKPAGAAAPTGNVFTSAKRRGICTASILGLGQNKGVVIATNTTNNTLNTILNLTGTGNPSDAPRWPGMARRDLLVAGQNKDGKWSGLIAGGRLTGEIVSAGSRIGSPGGPGGRETQYVAASTQNGRLAYDIARMAFRRTNNVIERLVDMAAGNWSEPGEPGELAADKPATADAGTIAGAVLQTIAPACETPEFSGLNGFVLSDKFPETFGDLVDWVKPLVPKFLDQKFWKRLTGGTKTIMDALDGLKKDATGTALYDELKREILSSCAGRRDTQWALAGAISRARQFIYIETPGFGPTRKSYAGAPPTYTADLLDRIRVRLAQVSGLRVIICTPKEADFADPYKPLKDAEVLERRTDILALLPAERVVAYHPIGFPGRSSRLESTVVIVDDVWALTGSSTFRRRGLTLDGSDDLVFTDTNLVEGHSPLIRDFRRRILANRLGIDELAGSMRHPAYVRLGDGVESFHLIREMLVAGGVGKIDRLWNGQIPGVPVQQPPNIGIDLMNPEGREFDLGAATLLSNFVNFDTSGG